MKKILLIILILCSIHFWRIIYFPGRIFDLADAFGLVVTGISFFLVGNKKNMLFRNAIILFVVGILLNIASAFFNHNQSLIDTFLVFGTYGYYFILMYFFLHEAEIDHKELERIIIIFACLYSLIYLIQFFVYPYPIVRGGRGVARGTLRIWMEGGGFLALGYFMTLNRYLLQRHIIYLILAMSFFIILVMSGFRTMIFGAFLLTGVLYLRLIRLAPRNFVLFFVLVLLFVGIFQFEGPSKILEEMINLTIKQRAEGENYIRIRELKYFYYEYPKNISYYIVGGGMPGTRSKYAQSMQVLMNHYGLFWDDLGIIGFYIVVGGVALMGILWFTIKAILIKLPPEKTYLSVYFLYLLIVSITTMEIYRPTIFGVEAIGLYLIDPSFVIKKV